jgi:hypothetical protein
MGHAQLGEVSRTAHHRGGLTCTGGDIDGVGVQPLGLVEPGTEGNVLQDERHALSRERDGHFLWRGFGCGAGRGPHAKSGCKQENDCRRYKFDQSHLPLIIRGHRLMSGRPLDWL